MKKIEINITRKYARRRTVGEMLADFGEGKITREEMEAEDKNKNLPEEIDHVKRG